MIHIIFHPFHPQLTQYYMDVCRHLLSYVMYIENNRDKNCKSFTLCVINRMGSITTVNMAADLIMAQ